MFCKNCGKEITNDGKYCQHCGKEINNSIDEYSSIKNKKKVTQIRPSTVILLIFVILILLGIGISSSLPTSSNTQQDSVNNYNSISNSNEIKIGEVITGKDWEFSVKDVTFGQRINPPDASGFYTYYQVDNTDNTYLCIVLNVKNLSELDLRASKFATLKVKYNNQYTYTSFSAIPDKTTGFTYTNITNIKPLTSDTIYFLSEMPKNISNEKDTNIQIEIKSEDKTYIYNYR